MTDDIVIPIPLDANQSSSLYLTPPPSCQMLKNKGGLSLIFIWRTQGNLRMLKYKGGLSTRGGVKYKELDW